MLSQCPRLEGGSYHIRFHVRDTGLTMDTLENLVTLYCGAYIIGYEDAKSPHYHVLVLQCNPDNILEAYKKMYPVAKGNKYFSKSSVKSLRKTVKYCLKDGNFRYKGFSEEEINLMFKKSHQKFDRAQWAEKLDIVLDSSDDPVTLFTDICMLYKEYGKPINFSHIKNIVITNTFNKNDFMKQGKLLFFDYYHS